MSNRRSQTAACHVGSREALAWEHYWKHANAARCVPHSALASRLVSAAWQEFARSIPRGARVLDLGTGLGYVLKEIGRDRPDLVLVGIDAVASLPDQSARVQIKAGVMMERLPFGNGDFDAVCSQFGFEYSDIEATADEVMRVLRPGGSVQLLLHHAQGIVVRQSASRGAALEWAMEKSGIFDKAARLIGDCHRLCNEASTACATMAVRAGEQRLDPVASEVASAVSQMIFAGERAWAQLIESTLPKLVTQGRNELAIIAALERVALDRIGVENVRTMLRNTGLVPCSPRVLEAHRGVPFAWLLQASKPAL